jgi:hypothetical protein
MCPGLDQVQALVPDIYFYLPLQQLLQLLHGLLLATSSWTVWPQFFTTDSMTSGAYKATWILIVDFLLDGIYSIFCLCVPLTDQVTDLQDGLPVSL